MKNLKKVTGAVPGNIYYAELNTPNNYFKGLVKIKSMNEQDFKNDGHIKSTIIKVFETSNTTWSEGWDWYLDLGAMYEINVEEYPEYFV
jgi:hypothetical protein